MRRMDIISAQWKPYDFLVKFLLVGDSDVGKEEILSGLVDGASESPYGYSNGMFVCIYVSVCVCMYVCLCICLYLCLCIMWSEVAFADVCRGHPMAGRHNLRSGSCPQ